MHKKNILPNAQRPLLFAHRGVSSLAPENTMAAFKKVKELGIPGVELDVHLTKSGELVVIHDESVKRTGRLYDGKTVQDAPDKDVERMTWEEVRQYDFGISFSPEFAGERIPLLADVLELLGPETYVDIEIKIDTMNVKPVTEKTYEVLQEELRKHPENPDRFLVSSFNPLAVRYFAKLCSTIPVSLIYDSNPEAPFYIRGGRGKLFCNPDVLKPCWKDYRAAKKESWVWTVDSTEIARGMLDKGATGLISNRPQDLLPLVRQAQEKNKA